jgi:glycosyltransferase involved in cell wall biosynthesis
MKILQINKFFYPKGGSEIYMFLLSDLLRQAGHEVIEFSMQDPKNLALPTGRQDSKFSQYFIKQIDFNKREGIFKDLAKAFHLLYSTEAKNKLEALIQKEKPDIAHLHNFNFQLTPSILRVLKKYKIPVIWTLHDYKVICPNYRLFTQNQICERCKIHKYYNCFTHKCLKNSWSMSFLAMLEMYLHKLVLQSYSAVSIYLSPSKFLAHKVLDWKLPKNKVRQVYHGLDLAQFKPSGALGEGLVYIGRLVEEKGILTLLEAIKQLPDINLKIVGSGPQDQEIERIIESYGLNNVQLIGHKSGQELQALIKQARLVVAPSIWYENSPLSILESFALGKPVIGSDLGGIPELVIDGQNGFLFKPGSVDDLIQKIKNVYYKDELISQMGKNCRAWVEKNCNSQKHLEEILKIYQEILK